MRSFILLFTAFILIECKVIIAQEDHIHAAKEFNVIEEDFRDGNIRYDEALLQKFYFVFDKSKLSQKYLGKISAPLKCATNLMNEYHKNRGILTAATVNEIEEYLNRPFRKTAENFKYISPSGLFELTYTTTGNDAVPAADNDGNGIPDYVEWIADYFDYSWAFEIDSLGYLAPPVGSGRYQIGFENMAYYGYTDYVNDSSGKMTRIVMHHNFNGFPRNTDPDGNQKGAAKATAAHEFKHAIQFVYNNWGDPGWFIEMDATWMEDIAYDYVNDYYNYLSASQIVQPSRSFSQGDGYEDCLWLHYISEKFGILSNRLIWERRLNNGSENIFNNFNNILTANYSSSFEKGIREYFVWNFSTGERSNGLFETYEEADKFPASTLCLNKSSLPDSSEGCGINPGAANLLLYSGNNQDKFLSVLFKANQAGTYGIEVLIVYKNGFAERKSVNADADNSINYFLPQKLSDIDYFVLIPVVVSTSGGLRSYSCKVSPFRTAEFYLTPLKDSELEIERTITAEVITQYNIAIKDSLKLFYSVNSSGFIPVNMVSTINENEFTAVIPPVNAGSTVEYYLSIYDTLGDYTYYPDAGSSGPLEYFTGPDMEVPVITHTSRTILNKYNFPVTIYAEVGDNLGVDSVFVNYRINKGGIFHKKLELYKRNLYRGKIEADVINPEDGDNLEYKITAVDISLNHNQKSFPGDNFNSIILSKSYQFVSSSSKEIKDLSPLGLKDTIIVGDDITISDFKLAFNASHNRFSDLIVRLITPFNKSGFLFNRPGLGTVYSNSKNPDIILDQDAYFNFGNFEPEYPDSISGEFRPDTMDFNSFNGNNAKGKWTLVTSDLAPGEGGTLNEWKLIISSAVITGNTDDVSLPVRFNLEQNFPNPFNPVTRISYSVPAESHIVLKIFDILGRQIAVLVDETKKQGNYEVDFDTRQAGASGSNLSSGIYFYRLEMGNLSAIKKMTLVK